MRVTLKHLENELRVQLFIRRHAQGLTLTPAGKRIARESKLVLRQAEALYSVALDLAGQHKPMTIGLATLHQEHKPMLLETFERHCREMISKRGIPGMVKV